MSRLKYTPEVQEYIRDHARGTSYRSMAEQLLNVFGLEVTPEQMKYYYKNHRLRNGNRPGGAAGKGIPTKYPPEMGDYIREIAEGRLSSEITEMVNERFGPGTITVRGLRSWKKNNKVRSGAHLGRLKPGCMSPNKGKHWDDFLSPEAQQRVLKNLFPKGHVPANIAKIGEIRVNTDGYLVKKVQDFGNQQKRWRFLHRLVWEEHNGPIPKGCVISFADGNKQNCAIENLVLETKAQHATKNRQGWKSWDRESAETYNLLADVKSAVSRKKRGKGGKS